MENQKIKKCIKCKKNTSTQEFTESSKGIICNECVLKAKKRKSLYRRIGVITAIFLLLGVFFFYFAPNRKSRVLGFKGATNIQDSMNIETQKPITPFRIESATAKSSPNIVSETIDNIESFKRVFSENLVNATNSNANTIIIPAISLFFDFDSSAISPKANDLLSEFAKTYLQTNRQAILIIHGYSCNYGTNDVNNWVSRLRAESVKHTLVSFGIPKDNMEIHWHGKSNNKDFSYPNTKDYRRAILSIK